MQGVVWGGESSSGQLEIFSLIKNYQISVQNSSFMY